MTLTLSDKSRSHLERHPIPHPRVWDGRTQATDYVRPTTAASTHSALRASAILTQASLKRQSTYPTNVALSSSNSARLARTPSEAILTCASFSTLHLKAHAAQQARSHPSAPISPELTGTSATAKHSSRRGPRRKAEGTREARPGQYVPRVAIRIRHL